MKENNYGIFSSWGDGAPTLSLGDEIYALFNDGANINQTTLGAAVDSWESGNGRTLPLSISFTDFSLNYPILFIKRKDKYIDAKNKTFQNFIDEDVENHFDYTLTYSRLFNKGKYHLPPQWYWDKMEKFFSFIESTSKLKIIIAAHHRRSKNNFPIKRKFVFNKTLDLVKNSKLVLMHDSTALHQGILCQKPIIFLNFNAYKKKLEQYLRILYFSKLTGAKVINLETFSFSKKNFNLDDYLKINIKQYKKYKDNYIKPPNSENIAIWKTVLGELDKFEN